jgi:hypothetical protein
MAKTETQADFGSTIASAYTFEGPALDLGRGVHKGELVKEAVVRIPLSMVNRHGLIAGATGTGKTKTLQGLAEQLSAAGVPVVAADMKGDVSGLATPGDADGPAAERDAELGIDYGPESFPVEFLSLGGIGPGVPVRASVSDFGPQLLAKVLSANETQEQSLSLVFRFADEKRLPLLDLADLRSLLQYLASDQGKAELQGLGGVSKQTVGVLLRTLSQLEDAGGKEFFGEPQLAIEDLLRVADDGRGIISCLELPAVQDKPALFSTALMWAPGRAVRGASGGRRPAKAEARVLLRRGAPALRRRDRRFPRFGRQHGAPDPVEGRGRVLRDADTQGHPRRRPRPARQPDSALAARLHPRRREGTQGDGLDLPEVGLLRRRRTADLDGDR